MDAKQNRGLEAAVLAYTLWGLLTLYWRQLRGLDALELIGWRITTAGVLMTIVVTVTHRWPPIVVALRDRAVAGRILLASLLLTVNWATYVWAVVNDHVIETALGYFLAPLGTMALGVFVFGERLTRLKQASIALAVVAVVMLTASYGRVPWVAVLLATSWVWYGWTKRHVPLEAVESLTSELLVLIIPALGLVTWGLLRDEGIPTTATTTEWVFLLGTGAITAVPLLLFAYAAKRVPFTVLGPTNYLVPIINFLLGWLVFDEALPPDRVIGFALVWVALVLITYDTLRTRTIIPGSISVDV
jgi:chloramphenicol-sensitive protein RarD